MFSEVPKGVKGAPKDIGEEDLKTAIDVHQRAYRDDKSLARLNVLHNFGLHKATGIGFFLPQRIQPMRMRGSVHPVIFADFIGVDDDWFRELDAGKLPYLSAEVRSWNPLEFGCLALLDTEPPFFNGFPNITIGNKVESCVTTSFTRFDQTERAPLLAASVSGSDARFLFRFEQEDTMPDEEKKDGEMDLSAAVKAIQEQMKALAPLLELKDDIAALVAGGDAAPETDAAPPIETEEEAKTSGPVEMAEGEEDTAEPEPEEEEDDEDGKPFRSASTKTDARLSALEDFKAATLRREARDARFSEATTTLENEGYNLSEGSRARLFKAAERGKETLALFLEEYRDTAPKDPPMDLDGLPASDEAWPSEVMHFANHGPDEFTRAKQVYREWKELRDVPAFGAKVTPLDKYLARNMRKGG